MVSESESRARASIDASTALDAFVGLLRVEPCMAVLELKEGVGAGINACAATDTVASDFGEGRHV